MINRTHTKNKWNDRMRKQKTTLLKLIKTKSYSKWNLIFIASYKPTKPLKGINYNQKFLTKNQSVLKIKSYF